MGFFVFSLCIIDEIAAKGYKVGAWSEITREQTNVGYEISLVAEIQPTHDVLVNAY